MQALIKNNTVIAYPYSPEQLKRDNPDVSFPEVMTELRLSEWNVFSVVPTAKPDDNDTTLVEETYPVLLNSQWVQSWQIVQLTAEQILQKQVAKSVLRDALRSEAYRNESDPIFFKAQRGEATMQEWLDKVASIKARF